MKKGLKFILSFIFVLCLANNISADNVQDWNGFGGDKTNSKITYGKTPTSNEDIDLVKVQGSLGNWISGGVMDPLIIGDKMYMVHSGRLHEFDMDGNATGRSVATGAVGFFSKIAYGDGKIFVAASTNIKAFDIETFEQIWQTPSVPGSQALSGITYHEGYIYTGIITTASSTSAPSNGFFFAVEVSDEDPTRTDEIKEYAWTYPITTEDRVNAGYYWSNPAIANDAVILAGDSGKVVSHHLTESLVYDSYQLSPNHSLKKVRSAVVYDRTDNSLFVTTQDSKELYKIPMVGKTFDRSAIKSTSLPDQVTGGISLGSTNIYVPSGGMSGKAFTVLDKDLNLVGTTNAYGTQSIPLVSEFADGITYIYFIEYASGSLIIAKDLNNGEMPTFSTYKNSTMTIANSFSVIPFFDGRLIVPFDSGFTIIDSKEKTVTKEDIEVLINQTDNLKKYTDYSKMIDIKQRVEDFKKANPEITIDETKLANNLAVLNSDMDKAAASVNKAIDQDLWLEVDQAIGTGSNLSETKQTEIATNLNNHRKLSDQIWVNINELSSDRLLNITENIYEKTGTNLNEAHKYSAYINHIANNLESMDDDANKMKIQEHIDSLLSLLENIDSDKAFATLNDRITSLPQNLTLNNRNEVTYITTIINGLSATSLETYKNENAGNYAKYEAAALEIKNQQAFVDKINEDIEKIDPLRVTYNDKTLVEDIIKRYNSLSNENKRFVSNWYQSVLDAKEEIDRMTVRTERDGNTTITYQKRGNDWFVIRVDVNTTSLRTIDDYIYDASRHDRNSTALLNGVRKTRHYNERKTNNVVQRRETINYNVNDSITSRTVDQINSSNRFVRILHNTRTYHSNRRINTNVTTQRHLNTGVLTSKRALQHHSNGNIRRNATTSYQSGKIHRVTDHRYNTQGQLRSNQALSIHQTYQNGRLNTHRRIQYHANGKRQRMVVTTYRSNRIHQVNDYRYNSQGQLRSNNHGNARLIRKEYQNGRHHRTINFKYNSNGRLVRA